MEKVRPILRKLAIAIVLKIKQQNKANNLKIDQL